MPITIVRLGLRAPAPALAGLESFYAGLGLPVARPDATTLALSIGQSQVEFADGEGSPFYHFALLVPGDRFEPALAWAEGHVTLLPEAASGEAVFDFTNWAAHACYFHDPSGNIVELIAHAGEGESGARGPFTAAELLGVSEIGVVCDPPSLATALEREMGLRVWDGSVAPEGGLAFVGEKARTLILCRQGRPWLPTGRPAEEHAVDVELAGGMAGEVFLEAGGFVRVGGSGANVAAAVQAS